MAHILVLSEPAQGKELVSYIHGQGGEVTHISGKKIFKINRVLLLIEKHRPCILVMISKRPAILLPLYSSVIKVHKNVPIVSLCDGAVHTVEHLNKGADACVSLEKSTKEIYAWIKAVLRRKRSHYTKSELRVGDVVYDETSHQTHLQHVDEVLSVDLKTKPRLLLHYLLQQEGRMITRRQIIESGVLAKDVDSRAVDALVRRLRDGFRSFAKANNLDLPAGFPVQCERGDGYLITRASATLTRAQ